MSQPVTVIAVSLAAERLGGGGLAAALAALADALGEPAGPRLICLPPLVANLAALRPEAAARGLNAATRAASRRRPLRAALVRLTYPDAHPGRRPWLVMHDRVHAILRGPIGDLARRAGATVLAGSALLDHPRRHWEAWPDRGNLFHTARCLHPSGEPGAVVRQVSAHWPALAEAHVDQSLSATPLLATPLGPVAVSWGDLELPDAAPIAWGLRLWREGERAAGTRGAEAIAEELLAGGAAVAVCSSLGGRLDRPLLDQTLIARPGHAPLRVVREPASAMAWRSVEVAL